MKDTIEAGDFYNSNNIPCTTYWMHKESDSVPPEEPETRKAQYEIDATEDSIVLRIFSRSSRSPMHKRDYYTYLKFPIDSRFSRELLEILKRVDKGNI